jgi:hypothetical protein
MLRMLGWTLIFSPAILFLIALGIVAGMKVLLSILAFVASVVCIMSIVFLGIFILERVK